MFRRRPVGDADLAAQGINPASAEAQEMRETGMRPVVSRPPEESRVPEAKTEEISPRREAERPQGGDVRGGGREEVGRGGEGPQQPALAATKEEGKGAPAGVEGQSEASNVRVGSGEEVAGLMNWALQQIAAALARWRELFSEKATAWATALRDAIRRVSHTNR